LIQRPKAVLGSSVSSNNNSFSTLVVRMELVHLGKTVTVLGRQSTCFWL